MSDWEIVVVRPTDEALWKQCIDVRLKGRCHYVYLLRTLIRARLMK